jgi:hypothetical protein
MRKLVNLVLCLCIILAAAGVLGAAGGRASPHEQASISLGGKKITIEYGRPSKKGRNIFGELVPWGKVWRTGADEATTLTTEADLTIGTIKLPKGAYALFTVPGEKEWTLVVNKEAKQWGAFKYDQKQDLGRTAMQVSQSAVPIEQFTIALEPQAGAANKATLKLSWDKTVASVQITQP